MVGSPQFSEQEYPGKELHAKGKLLQTHEAFPSFISQCCLDEQESSEQSYHSESDYVLDH